MYRIELKNDRLTATLERLDRGLADLSPVMVDIGEYLVTSTKARFGEGTSPEGVPWAPKSEATKDAYRSRKDPLDPRPLYGPSKRLSSEIVSLAGPASVEVGSSLIYAAVMQFGEAKGAAGAMSSGAPIPWGDIPARPYLGLSAEDTPAIVAIVETWLEGLVEG